MKTAIIIIASWYFLMGNVMANGKPFTNRLTCASWDFPLGTVLKITNLDNNKSVFVTNTDRTDRRFAGQRIDLSRRAFERIAKLKVGIIQVKVEVVK